MNFIFSEEDKEIIGSMRYVDPLGMQPIWHFYARRIIPNLTEQTSTIQGFVLFIFIINLYNEYNIGIKKDKEISLISFFLIVEKLLGISISHADRLNKLKEATWKLRGIEGIYGFLNSNDTIIIQGTAILLNQKANGTWGLYRGAVIRSNIIVEPNDQNILHDDFNNIEIKDKGKIIDFLREKIQVNEGEIIYSIEVNECDELKNSFLDLINKDSDFIKKVFYFIFKNPQKPHDCNTNFMKELPSKIKEIQTVQEYFTTLDKDSKDYDRLNDIIEVENYLSYLSNCFYYILDNIDKQADDIVIFNDGIIKELFKFKDEVDRLKEKSINTSAGTRLEIYNKYLHNPNFSNYELINALINIHNEVVKSRNKEPWIEIENTKLKLKISRSRNSNGKLDNKWVNSYYINSLMSLRREMEEYGIQ